MKRLGLLWGVLGLLFFVLGIFNLFFSNYELSYFEITEISDSQDISVVVGSNDINYNFNKIITDFNNYISEVNITNNRIRFVNGIGYLIASLIAFSAAFISYTKKLEFIAEKKAEKNKDKE